MTCVSFPNEGNDGAAGRGASWAKDAVEAEVSVPELVLQRRQFAAQHQVAFSLRYDAAVFSSVTQDWWDFITKPASSVAAGRSVRLVHFSQVQRFTMMSVHSPTAKPSAVRLDSCTLICIWNIWEPSRPQKVLIYESDVRRREHFFFDLMNLFVLICWTPPRLSCCHCGRHRCSAAASARGRPRWCLQGPQWAPCCYGTWGNRRAATTAWR